MMESGMLHGALHPGKSLQPPRPAGQDVADAGVQLLLRSQLQRLPGGDADDVAVEIDPRGGWNQVGGYVIAGRPGSDFHESESVRGDLGFEVEGAVVEAQRQDHLAGHAIDGGAHLRRQPRRKDMLVLEMKRIGGPLVGDSSHQDPAAADESLDAHFGTCHQLLDDELRAEVAEDRIELWTRDQSPSGPSGTICVEAVDDHQLFEQRPEVVRYPGRQHHDAVAEAARGQQGFELLAPGASQVDEEYGRSVSQTEPPPGSSSAPRRPPFPAHTTTAGSAGYRSGHRQTARYPPSITKACPVMYEDSREARKRTSEATSSGFPWRC